MNSYHYLIQALSLFLLVVAIINTFIIKKQNRIINLFKKGLIQNINPYVRCSGKTYYNCYQLFWAIESEKFDCIVCIVKEFNQSKHIQKILTEILNKNNINYSLLYAQNKLLVRTPEKQISILFFQSGSRLSQFFGLNKVTFINFVDFPYFHKRKIFK